MSIFYGIYHTKIHKKATPNLRQWRALHLHINNNSIYLHAVFTTDSIRNQLFMHIYTIYVCQSHALDENDSFLISLKHGINEKPRRVLMHITLEI